MEETPNLNWKQAPVLHWAETTCTGCMCKSYWQVGLLISIGGIHREWSSRLECYLNDSHPVQCCVMMIGGESLVWNGDSPLFHYEVWLESPTGSRMQIPVTYDEQLLQQTMTANTLLLHLGQ